MGAALGVADRDAVALGDDVVGGSAKVKEDRPVRSPMHPVGRRAGRVVGRSAASHVRGSEQFVDAVHVP
jgi:hypothetical protein